VPRVSDDDVVGGVYSIHVPGAWFRVVQEIRDRSSTAGWRYLDCPSLVLTMARDEYDALAKRARREADEKLRRAAGSA
jgi:hypothetical protein